jgi:hypothetical protein
VTDIESKVAVGELKLEVDLLINKTAYKVLESAKIAHDQRFVERKSALEVNKILLLGDESYTLSRQIIQGYNEAQLNPMTAYYMKYYEGINYKLIDGKRIKDDLYLRHVI